MHHVRCHDAFLGSDRGVEVFALGREDELFKHVERLATEFARLIRHIFVIIVIHQTDPLLKGVAEDPTALILVLLTLVEVAVLELQFLKPDSLISILLISYDRV
jgi:hypothetical protein